MKHLLAPFSLLLLSGAAALPARGRVPDILARIQQERQQLELALGAESTPSLDGGDDGTAAAGDVATLSFGQRLDHFSNEADGQFVTFQQRYFHTSRYAAPQSSSDGHNDEDADHVLAFLCVGGEGPSMDASVLVDSVHCTGDMVELAKRLHEEHGHDVHLFALEHRYYGESFPPQPSKSLRGDGASDEFLVDYTHLSSRQAVKDIAAFVQSPATLQHLHLSDDAAKKVRWVTFGGSYPGMLSAWSHLLHPEAIFAAVSSSSPIQNTLDFQKYNEHVGSDLADADVGGSELCHSIVKEGHEQVVAIFEGRGLDLEGEAEAAGDSIDLLADIFNVCGGGDTLRESKRSQEIFVGDGLIGIPAQGNDPSCTGELCNIKGLCNAIVNRRKANPNQSSMDILAGVRQVQNKGACDNVSWKSYLEWYGTPTQQNANDRSWLYQTCSEFGFYQTCNSDSSCPYGRGYHDVSQDLEVCQTLFGIDPDTVKSNVESTLTYYGGWKLTPNTGEQAGPRSLHMVEDGEDTLDGQKRILFVTGDVDPWTELALTDGTSDHPSVSARGASHHFWTHQVKDSDGDAIVAARKSIYDTVSDWLGVSARSVIGRAEEPAVVAMA